MFKFGDKVKYWPTDRDRLFSNRPKEGAVGVIIGREVVARMWIVAFESPTSYEPVKCYLPDDCISEENYQPEKHYWSYKDVYSSYHHSPDFASYEQAIGDAKELSYRTESVYVITEFKGVFKIDVALVRDGKVFTA